MANYSYELPDTLPSEYVTDVQSKLDTYIKRTVMKAYALSKSQINGYNWDPVETQGRTVLTILLAEKAYAKRVLIRIYQNGLFTNWLSLHVNPGDITLVTDGITDLSDLQLALDDPV